MPSTLAGLLDGSLVIITSLVVLASLAFSQYRSTPPFPVINVRKKDWTLSNGRNRFLTNAADLLLEGQRQTDGPFCIITDRKTMTYLPPHYAEYIKNDRRFSFTEYAHRDMMGYLPGFDAFGSLLKSGILIEIVQKRLSPMIDKMSGILSNTMDEALQSQWSEETEFHEIPLHATVLAMVSRVTGRVFVGAELSNNPDWLRLSVTYTVNAFMASKELGKYSWPVRWIVQWFNVRAQQVRASLKEARQILTPILAQRAQERAANGGKSTTEDAIEWHQQLVGDRKSDGVVVQVGLALSAIHTTGDLLFKTIGQLAHHQEVIPAVRKEIADAISTHGLNKTGVYHMQLLDSIIKETQRLDAVALAIMNRYATEEVELPNGVTIPKGSQTSVITDIMRSEKTYENAKEWDPYRFYNIRRSGQEQKGQLVSATAEHFAFGFGKHACPGRFFAAHELKIMLAHILLKYDFEYIGTDRPKVRVVGTDVLADNSPRMQVRRRHDYVIPRATEETA
ncbi:hypothetical protein LT330_007580 [Penicillium expansum]|nr:hypothetical protein LT330_007580 [Penicillium expansum]